MTEETIFTAALEERSQAGRAAFLAEACAGDEALRRRVEALLASHEHPAFLETPAAELAAIAFGGEASPGMPGPAAVDGPALAERPGTVIGPYRLLQPIGEGGMGTVYLAEQAHPVRRQVALKLIRPGMDRRQVLARFAAERQALALMDHPNIARVLDAGVTETDRPYFVMELVRGIPITRFCDDRRLAPRQRLELFIPVCQAVQHAHQKGIIHRDIKPSNVLVALYDGKPVPKIIDFGVAKATGQSLTDATLFTGFGTIVGTPEYMSPEQAELNQLDVDTRSDIYSLGVLLYELLTGSTPLRHRRLERASLLEVLRLVREEEPPRPSARLSTTEELPSIAGHRGIEPRRLRGLIRGELDWIAMKALEKDRDRRYQTAASLAADVRRHLANEPVQASPASAGYRLRKFVRRHRGPALAVAMVGLALVGGIIGTTWGMLRATRARAEAVSEARRRQAAFEEKDAALTAARRSARDADEKLFASYLDQARANLMSRRPGRRFATLEILRRATGLARALGLPDERFRDLRQAAIAALALPDLHPAGPAPPWPADGSSFSFDEAHARYARADRDGHCSIRRVADDVETHRLPGPGAPVLSPDGRFVAVVGRDPDREQAPGARVWRLDRAAPHRLISEVDARYAEFRRDGRRVVLVYTDGSIGLFELGGGRQVGRLAPDTLRREVVCASHPTEPLIAVCSYFGTVVQVRDLRSGKVVASLPQAARPHSVAWHPDGRCLAVGLAEDGSILLYDRATFRPFRRLEVGDTASSLAFNHAGDRLATSGWGRSVALFDVGTGRRLFATASMPFVTLCFGVDDRRLAGAVQDGALRIWQVADGREYRTLFRESLPDRGQYLSASVSPDGRWLAAAMADGFGLWDLDSGRELALIPTGGVYNNRVLFEPTGALLALGPDGLSRWPIVRGPGEAGRWVMGPPERLPLPRGQMIHQSRDGRVIATCSRAAGGEQAFAGGWILHADRPGEPMRIDAGVDIGSVAVSPDGRWVVTVTFYGGRVEVRDARDGRLVKRWADPGAVSPSFSPDGRWLSANLDGGRLLEMETWRPGPRVGRATAFAPDGRLVAEATTGGAIRLVDPATGRELAILEDPDQDPSSPPIFTPDGTRLIAVSLARGLHVWDLRLIRRHLDGMGLDWDAPPYPPADPDGETDAPRKVEVRIGDAATPALPRERARQDIEHYRRAHEMDPDRAETCNSLAWAYLTAPGGLRDVRAALPLAEKAVRLEPGNGMFANTLGVAYYRAGRHREAIGILRPNLDRQEAGVLAFDLFFLAMSHQRLGEAERARDYYDWAVRWMGAQPGPSAGHLEELKRVRAEAEEALRIGGERD